MLGRNSQVVLLSTAIAFFIYNQANSMLNLSSFFSFLDFYLLARVFNALFGKKREVLARNSDRA